MRRTDYRKRSETGIDLPREWQKIAHRAPTCATRSADPRRADGALDAPPEFECPALQTELSKGKTAVLISHRFSSVRMADRVVVLADGSVEAIGTHDQLLAQNGRYAELFELQAAGYR
jgi:ATP-binding cassette subfamily B protein